MHDESSSYSRQHFINALSSALEDLGPAKEVIFRYLEDKRLIPFPEGKVPSVEQVEIALRDILGSGADTIIRIMKEKLESDSMKMLWPSTAPLFAYTGCLFGCAGLVCCGMIEICKLGMTNAV